MAHDAHNIVPNIVPINMVPNAKKPAIALLIIKSGANNLGYGRFQTRSARYPYPAKDKNANGRIPMQNLIFLPASKQMVNCTIAGTRIKSGKKSISSRNIQPPCCNSSPQNGHFMKTTFINLMIADKGKRNKDRNGIRSNKLYKV